MGFDPAGGVMYISGKFGEQIDLDIVGRMFEMKEAKASELIRQPCVEGMCFRLDIKTDTYIYCQDLKMVHGDELKACMPSSENEREAICNCYAYPEAWHRKGGCPRNTVPYEIDRPKKAKKVNPLKASKRGQR